MNSSSSLLPDPRTLPQYWTKTVPDQDSTGPILPYATSVPDQDYSTTLPQHRNNTTICYLSTGPSPQYHATSVLDHDHHMFPQYYHTLPQYRTKTAVPDQYHHTLPQYRTPHSPRSRT
eukprot:556912-Rhodomonas_salina.1